MAKVMVMVPDPVADGTLPRSPPCYWIIERSEQALTIEPSREPTRTSYFLIFLGCLFAIVFTIILLLIARGKALEVELLLIMVFIGIVVGLIALGAFVYFRTETQSRKGPWFKYDKQAELVLLPGERRQLSKSEGLFFRLVVGAHIMGEDGKSRLATEVFSELQLIVTKSYPHMYTLLCATGRHSLDELAKSLAREVGLPLEQVREKTTPWLR